jgi:hypothetical protein
MSVGYLFRFEHVIEVLLHHDDVLGLARGLEINDFG